MLKNLRTSHQPLIIAEVGQNHQGQLENALEYIHRFTAAGADVIKFQTRNNRYLFSEAAYNKSYDSENAFGPTYGEHREQLELTPKEKQILRSKCREAGALFMSTPFDEHSLQLLVDLETDLLKIASFDIGNLPFIDRIAATGIPVVVSTGGATEEQIRSSVDTILRHHDEIALLHCVSEYPCEYNHLGLHQIERFLNDYPDITIGLSDHFNGIVSGPVGYMCGARVFEKHVTLNRSWKGTDHSFALEPDGFRRFTRDIKRIPAMMTPKPKESLGTEPVFQKLGKSLAARVPLNPGDQITLEKVTGKIFDKTHIPVRESNTMLGRRVIHKIDEGMPIRHEDLADSD
ncbi:N-acetylneuraminate synthase family protein [Cyanobium sp. ATX 6F1]|uniref:N-acetylneuraminate synthase family protein n=1 Tax=unclassified Cyanobium TaxID=2627006 RepID=UPI0020CEC9E1|nr:N-acetylneuraminate synthase family protein [Cyanobium sp. ATX 6F1]MCP9916798.1 N-acetylneuraminate synthase family protein [Cyanobium sp. ATX 6F1]